MKKRIASVLVALVMVLSLVPKTSWAWTSTVTTLEQLKSAMSELSYNNTIEIVVSGTIEISETLNIRPTRTTNGSMAWYEYYNQRVVISGADANSKLVRAEGFKGSLFNLTGEQAYSGAGGSDHPAYAALTLKDITVDGGGDKTTATNPAIYVSRYGTLTLEDGAVLRNCKASSCLSTDQPTTTYTTRTLPNTVKHWSRPTSSLKCRYIPTVTTESPEEIPVTT